jgi:uncharacterized circularly permuted ATP-grasp superfamily protein/uncharacterized alpha-E superfamily protein
MSISPSADPRTAPLFECPPEAYNEVYDASGGIRAQWKQVLQAYRQIPQSDFARRNSQAERQLRENGVTFHSFAHPGETARPWKLDLLPLVISTQEWATLEDGLAQRAALLNALIQDLYGPQRVLKERIIPPEALFANPHFIRPFCNLTPAETNPLFLYASELARSSNGTWWVMADRSEAPGGPGFALENRIISSRTIPGAFKNIHVERLASFFVHLQNSLKRRAPRGNDSPRIVMLTQGPTHRYYFEDVYLARYLGYTLVEGGDLAVRNDTVSLKTLSGLLQVDVILSRCAEAGLDPLEAGGHAAHGVPGLLNAVRNGNVALANTPGCGIVGAPVFMAFLPQICQYLLGQSLRMPSIRTLWCGDRESYREIVSRLNDLVIKPAFQKSGGEEIIVSELSQSDRDQLLRKINAESHLYVAQEKIARSGVPVWSESGIRCGHVAMRTFLVEDEARYRMMPGALVRVAPDTGPMQLSVSAGDGSKDLWVLSDRKVEKVSLLAPIDQPAELRRTSALFPSRVADNLFWLGRTLDRCDFLARIIRSLAERLLTEGGMDVTGIRFLTRVLSEQGQLEPGFVVDGLESQLPSVTEALPIAVFDVSESSGLAGTIAYLLRLASLVRDWLSPDTWQRIHLTSDDFTGHPGNGTRDLTDVVTSTSQLIANIASVSGLIADGMNRGPSWRFLELGRTIERTGATARMLLSVDLRSGPAHAAVLKTLIEVLDVQMTYRFRYRDVLQRNAVLDLAITDETNPRSLVYQMERLVSHVDRLPGFEARPLRSEEMLAVMECTHAIRMLTAEDLSAAVPKKVLDALKKADNGMVQLSQLLTKKYLVHSGTPRQISDLPGGAL